MAEKINIALIGSPVEYQEYSSQDLNLIQKSEINSEFGQPEDYIETYVYDLNNNLLFSNNNNTDYKLSSAGINPSTKTSNIVELFPDKDVLNFNIDRGSVNVVYNFYRKLLKSSQSSPFWIKEISPNRTELKVVNQDLSEQDLLAEFSNYQIATSAEPYYFDFLLNFGSNTSLIGVNLAITPDLDGQSVLLVKLYEPLPNTLVTKSTFWFVEKLNEPLVYNVSFEVLADPVVDNTPRLRGPNYNVNLNQKNSQAIEEYTYEDLFTTPVSSSYQQLKSLLDEKGVEINVDYSGFSNFIHFSSATDRLYNFKYKLQLIESYSAEIKSLETDIIPAGNTSIIRSSKDVLQSKINALIEKFDGYEYYLYYESGTFSWPKYTASTSYLPYSVSSSQATNWLGSEGTVPTVSSLSMLYSASSYDNQNKDLFLNTIPSYLREDPQNAPYEAFLNMVGQHFDNIWIYLKDVTERYNASNKLTKGISKDLVGDALKSLGINLYTNTNISDNLYYSILGYNANGTLLPPTGSEVITYYITSSESTLAAEDITLEYYKRLYHNLPYLLKTKGTERGVRALINCYGIPDTILRINEYGGVPKSGDYAGLVQNRFSLAYQNNISSSLVFPWAPSYYQFLKTTTSSLVPSAIEFRFKSQGIPTASRTYSQNLFQIASGSTLGVGATIRYSPVNAKPTSSFEKYGYLTLYVNTGTGTVQSTDELYLPIFDPTQWWTVLVQRETGSAQAGITTNNKYWIYAKSSFYNEEGISQVGFQASASLTVNGTTSPGLNSSWLKYGTTETSSYSFYLGGSNPLFGASSSFSGYYQELRYWADPIPESAFDRHVLNSRDYSLASATSSHFNLVLRAPLGNDLTVPYRSGSGEVLNSKDYDLYLSSKTTISSNAAIESVHPGATGSHYIPEYGGVVAGYKPFKLGTTIYGYGKFAGSNPRRFVAQEFVDLIAEPSTGISQRVNNKVVIETAVQGTYPVSTVVTPFTTVQTYDTDRTISNADLDVAFSLADFIDNDIINQLGNFVIDEYIGAPSSRYSSSYVDLAILKADYFSKYSSKFSIKDSVRVLKYVDNSLFKMLKDFTPARANLTTGVLVKSHLLERNVVPRHEPTLTQTQYSSSLEIGTITGTTPQEEVYTSSYTASIITSKGLATKVYCNGFAQFTGQYSGSELPVVDGLFEQVGISNTKPVDSTWYFRTYSLDPLYNNVTESRKSTLQYDADYNSSQIVPVNYGVITQSINGITSGNISSRVSKGTPWAQIQDSNYTSKAFRTSRYEGSKTISKLYTTYSVGDSSYGKTAAIDKTRIQYTYLKDIYTASLTLPLRSNAQIKYLLDDKESVIDLTKENNNIFDIQNLYKGGDKINISLFDYANQSTNTLTNRSIEVFEGGYRYLPILHNISGSLSTLTWIYPEPQPITVTVPGSSGTVTPPCDLSNQTQWGDPTNWWVKFIPNTVTNTLGIQIRYKGTGNLPTGANCKLILSFTYNTGGSYGCTDQGYVTNNYGTVEMTPTSNSSYFTTTLGFLVTPCDLTGVQDSFLINTIYADSVSSTPPVSDPTPPTTYTTFVTTVDDDYTCLKYVATPTQPEYTNRLVKLPYKISDLLYNNVEVVFDYTKDPAVSTNRNNIDKVVLPFSLQTGDAIHFPYGMTYIEAEEYRIVETFFSGSSINRRLYAVTDRPINFNVQTTAATNTVDGDLCKYIITKHVPDETNVILRYNPVEASLVEEGIFYPQDIQEPIRKNAGNVIKSLKSQGLI